MRHLFDLIKRLNEYGFKVSREKTKLLQRSVKFLGHNLSEKGVEQDHKKVGAIDSMPIPTNVNEVRSFLGMVNYFRRFGKHLSNAMVSLNKLIKKGQKLIIGSDSLIFNASIIKYPDFHMLFVITTDASNVALGAILT